MDVIDTDEVEGVDVHRARAAYWMLAEAGIPEQVLRDMRYALDVSQCTECKRSWLRRGESRPLQTMPPWQRDWNRSRKGRGASAKPASWLNDCRQVRQFFNETQFSWGAHSCTECIAPVAARHGFAMAKMPRKTLNAFLRVFKATIAWHKDMHRREDWSDAHRAYVGITNAILQNTKPEGNKVAMQLLVDISHELGLI